MALTADLPSVITYIDRVSEISDLAVLVKHLAMVAACAAVLDWVVALRPPRRDVIRQVQAAAASVTVTLTVLWLMMSRAETTQFTEAEHGWVAAVYLWVFYAWLAATMSVAAWLFWQTRNSRHAELLRPGMRASVAMLALGTGTAVLFAVTQAAALAIRTARLDSPPAGRALLDATAVLEDIAIVVIVSGACLPALATGWQALAELHELRRLRPLWAALTEAAPAVKVELGARTIRHVHVRLIRRVVEIRDAARHLAPYVPEQVVTATREELAASGLSDGDLDVATEACWLRIAAEAASSGCSRIPGTWHVLPGGGTLAEETTWQRRLASAWSWELVKQIAAVNAITEPSPAGTADGHGSRTAA